MSLDGGDIAGILAALVPAVGAFLLYIREKGKTKAEANKVDSEAGKVDADRASVIVDASTDVVKLLRDTLEETRKMHEAARSEWMEQLRERDARILELESKVAKLEAQEKVAVPLRKQVAELQMKLSASEQRSEDLARELEFYRRRLAGGGGDGSQDHGDLRDEPSPQR